MVSYSGLTREIKGVKKRLIEKAQNTGIYENFGLKELFQLRNKYNYDDLVYGTPKQRRYAKKIDEFEQWSNSFNIDSFKKNGITYRRYF